MVTRSVCTGMALALVAVSSLVAEEPTATELEFFESRIRPVLIEHCYDCHNSGETREGGLALDHRTPLRSGGDGGAILVPGQPAASRLLSILRHEIEGLEMPQGGPQLDARIVDDFERWIEMGAPDPRTSPPTADELAAETSWDRVLQRRRGWWSFQPIRAPNPPDVADLDGSQHPIDRFIWRGLKNVDLRPAPPASPEVLVRRLYFNLIGLPPDPQSVKDWTRRIRDAGDRRPQVVASLVDVLLESPRFGERWARHWMDWIRYAESHGSEGDPDLDNAWYYRDYLIRALNADVPYDQLVREHIAGDLLDSPRVNEGLGFNESAIGPAHWRMVFHGFAPTDALEEKVRFTDDQINAFSKAFLGLTLSCARCHHHKFDPISQDDYYALFGVIASCRPARTVIDLPSRTERHVDALRKLKEDIHVAVAEDWLASLDGLANRLSESETDPGPQSLRQPWYRLRHAAAEGMPFTEVWQELLQSYRQRHEQAEVYRSAAMSPYWHLGRESDREAWFREGIGLRSSESSSGEFSVATSGEQALVGIYPAGLYSHPLSDKHAGRLTSSDFAVTGEWELWVQAIGDGQAALRYVVQDYPRNGTVYPVTQLKKEWRWQRYDLSYWTGDEVHIELVTAQDAPLLVKKTARSWFGVREALVIPKGAPAPAESIEHLEPLFAAAEVRSPQSLQELRECYIAAMETALQDWIDNSLTDEQALFLDACIREQLLPNQLDALKTAAPLLQQYRQLESDIPVPTRVPGLDETVGRDQPLYERGNHKRPGSPVPRRFLEAIDPTPYATQRSGRLHLAEDLLRSDNPLTRRVIVNRVWHHLWGRGLVSTPDNLGQMGTQPTHPELLDWLATRFSEDGWSLKQLIRRIVTSHAWQRSSTPTARAAEDDPDNRWLSRAHVRRLEAEAIRDSLLAVSGQIEHRLEGSPVNGDSSRRSVYMRVIRNSLDPFLRVFDFPEPYSAVGRRDVTNVPAQSLTMMNDPRVSRYATTWAQRVLENSQLASDEERIAAMFLAAFGREPRTEEVVRIREYLKTTAEFLTAEKREASQLETQIAERRKLLASTLTPVRERLLSGKEEAAADGSVILPEPIARWEFDGDAQDSVGTAHGELRGNVRLTEGALVLESGGHVITAPLAKPLLAKTLEAWVQLADLEQRGGGVITVQSPNGNTFDAIVFGERDPRRWLAGSNNFRRTQPFVGTEERDAVSRPVHVAIVYHADGRIEGYRDGQPYGEAYQSNGPQAFAGGETVVGFGIRHLPEGGNRMLTGRIHRAQLYDCALTAGEVAASSETSTLFVTDRQVLAALTSEQRERVRGWQSELTKLESQLSALGAVAPSDDVTVWSDLARALFTFPEFIYVR